MDLRARARDLFAAACQAADPAQALTRALKDHPLPRPDQGGRLIVLAIGKAAVPMAGAVLALPQAEGAVGIVVTNRENARPVPGAQVLAAGHPVPDEGGEAAARVVEAALQGATAADRVVALISGGGSALLPAPVDGVTLADKAAVNRLLLARGFDITEMNLVRQALSRLKGGGMLRKAAPAPVVAYILSDVIGDDLRVIASGPTVAPLGTRDAARALVQARGLWPDLPASVRAALDRQDGTLPPLPPVENHLIGSNRQSLMAVQRRAGPGAVIVRDDLTGDVGQAAEGIVRAASTLHADCLIFGGETTVTLRGGGLGGRNQELALRVALAMPDGGRDWVFLSGGTDGRDGPTRAAGGIVDRATPDRIRAAGGDPLALLADNDSHRALDLAGDLLVTGAAACSGRRPGAGQVQARFCVSPSRLRCVVQPESRSRSTVSSQSPAASRARRTQA